MNVYTCVPCFVTSVLHLFVNYVYIIIIIIIIIEYSNMALMFQNTCTKSYYQEFITYRGSTLHITKYMKWSHNGYCHCTQQLHNFVTVDCSLLQSSLDDTGIKNPLFILGTDGGWYGNLRANTLPTLESVMIRISLFRPNAISRSSI